MNRPVASPVLQIGRPAPPFPQLLLDVPNCTLCRPLPCLAIDPVNHRLAEAPGFQLEEKTVVKSDAINQR